MKIVSRLIAALTLVALTGSVFAQSVSVGSEVGQKGSQVILEPSFTAGSQEVDVVQFVVTFANPALANFSGVTVAATCGGTLGSNNQCVVSPSADAFQIIVSSGINAMPTGTLASITFTIDGAAAAGDVALVVDPASIVIGRNGVPADPPVPVSDGNIAITAGPQPLFAATPASVALSGQISTALEADVVIDNNGGDDGSTLTYTCTVPAGKFTISGDTTDFAVAKGSTGTVTVACDSSAIGGPFNDTMSCTHDGSNTTPVDIPLSCTVTAGPEPAYTGVASGLVMVATEQGDPDPTGSVAITNTGDATTTLTGTCTLTGPDAQITVSNGAFSVAEGAAAHSVAVSCDASAEGSYTNTLSCTHNGTNVAPPATYPVTCDVGPPGPAVYLSVPAPGAVIDMTTTDVPVGAVVPDQIMTITNDAAEANDRDLALMGCAWAGDAAITATAPTTPVAAQASTSVTFSCDTAAVGDYTGTYSCPYDLDGDATADGTATYTVNCGVRAAAADILESPISGTALNILVPIGGTAQTTVNFSEILDEGVDATVDSCSFGTAIFSVVTTLPATVTAGGTAAVSVSGSDNGSGALTFTDTLTCTYTDTDSTPGTASWPITLTVLAQPIPTLSTWGLMLMILTLMGLGGIVIRRKVES